MMRHLLAMIILVGVTLLAHFLSTTLGFDWSPAHTLVATGFLLLVAFSAGEVARSVGLPALLGYLVTGVLLGPSLATFLPVELPLTMLTDEVRGNLEVVNVLVVGVIGMYAGARLRLNDFAPGHRRLWGVIAGGIFLAVVPITAIVVLAAGRLFPESLSFLVELPLAAQVSVALLFGVLAFGLGQSTALKVIEDLRARGTLSSSVLGVTRLGDLGLFAAFALMFSVASFVAGVEGIDSTTSIVGLFAAVTLDLVRSLFLGLGVGLVAVLYLRLVRRELLLFGLATIFVAYYLSWILGTQAVVVFFVAGLLVQNASDYGEPLVHALERIGMPVLVVYFGLTAAGLDLQAMVGYLPLVFALIGARTLGHYVAIRLTTRKARERNRAYELLGFGLVSQDAVVLVLAGIVARAFTTWGPTFEGVILTTAVVYLVLGPLLLKYALNRVGESEHSHVRSLEESARQDDLEAVAEAPLEDQLPRPEFGDSWLRGHIDDRRESLLEVDRALIRRPLLAHREHVEAGLHAMGEVIEGILAELVTIMEGQPPEGDSLQGMQDHVEALYQRYENALGPVISALLEREGIAVSADAMGEFLDTVHDLEDIDSAYKVEREAVLFEPLDTDGRPVLMVKHLRRLRRRLWGPGYRNVPVGRLWRYYIDLALPVSFARTAPRVSEHNELFWRNFGRHVQGIEELFNDVLDLLFEDDEDRPEGAPALADTELVASPKAAAIAADNGEQAYEEDDARVFMSQGHELASELVDDFVAGYGEQHEDLVEDLHRATDVALYRYGAGLARNYQAFLAATTRAGTVELPAFRYRPALRFDAARRAENRLHERLMRQEMAVSGYRGWLIVDHEVAVFAQWLHSYQDTAKRAIGALIEQSGLQVLESLRALCGDPGWEADSDETRDWPTLFEQEFRPALSDYRRTMEQALATTNQGVITRDLLELLEVRVERVSEAVSVLAQEPDRSIVGTSVSLFALPLRQWLMVGLNREISLRFVEFNERSSVIFNARLQVLDSIEQVLEFNLVTAQSKQTGIMNDALEGGATAAEPAQSESFAISGLKRAAKMVAQSIEVISKESTELQEWLEAEVEGIVAQTFEPLQERRVGDVQRELARREAASFVARGESLASEFLRPLASRFRSLSGRVSTYGRELSADIRALLIEEHKIPTREGIRQRLRAGEPNVATDIPAIYRRLFTPVPLDLPDFYVARPQVEARCLHTITQWLEGQPHSMLITGERGVGKRTLIHHLVPTHVHHIQPTLTDDQFTTIRLAEEACTEEGLCRQLTPLLLHANRVPRSFEEFSGRIRVRTGRRQIAVLENADKIFTRTPDGLQCCRQFLNMIGETSDRILWIVIMGSAAVTYLETTLGVRDYFTHVSEVSRLEALEIERMVMSRHQVSGFEIDFLPHRLSRIERLRRPFIASTTRAQPHREFFGHLTRFSRGNPHLALLYWLKAVHIDPQEPSQIVVTPLSFEEIPLLELLSLPKRLILGLLSQQSSLTAVQLQEMLRLPKQQVDIELEHLQRLGFVELLTETQDLYRVRPLADPLVADELQRMNLA